MFYCKDCCGKTLDLLNSYTSLYEVNEQRKLIRKKLLYQSLQRSKHVRNTNQSHLEIFHHCFSSIKCFCELLRNLEDRQCQCSSLH